MGQSSKFCKFCNIPIDEYKNNRNLPWEHQEWINEMQKKLPKKQDPPIDEIDCDRSIIEDGSCFAILPAKSYTPGHAIVVLKRHRSDITDVEPDELKSMCETIIKCAKAIKETDKSIERVYVACLCEDVEHFHLHLIPRRNNIPKHEWGFRYLEQIETTHNMKDYFRNKEQKVAYWREELRKKLQDKTHEITEQLKKMKITPG